MTLAQVNGPMRVRDVAAQLPFLSEQFVGKHLATMHADGLVIRDHDFRGAPYRLSARHVTGPRTPHGVGLVPYPRDTGADGRSRAGRECRRLHLRHSTGVIQVFDSADSPMRFVHIAEAAGLDNGLARQRPLWLQADRLVARTGSRHGESGR